MGVFLPSFKPIPYSVRAVREGEIIFNMMSLVVGETITRTIAMTPLHIGLIATKINCDKEPKNQRK